MTHILPIGGGNKGGSGKSFLTGNLGILLANQGKETLIIDVDLGAANLHTMTGIPFPEKSLSDFINKKVETLAETAIQTSIPNLSIISGARNNLDISNIPYLQKIKLLRAIPRLPYEYILLDLGAGTSFNTIDFFMISCSGIFVTTPEPTSIENIYRLIRSVYFRKIRQVLNLQDFKVLVDKVSGKNKNVTTNFLSEISCFIDKRDPEKAKALTQSLNSLQFKLVLNQVRKYDNPNLGFLMCKLIRKHLGINVEFLGNIGFDDRVHNAVSLIHHQKK